MINKYLAGLKPQVGTRSRITNEKIRNATTLYSTHDQIVLISINNLFNDEV